jgi:hypothetical protein
MRNGVCKVNDTAICPEKTSPTVGARELAIAERALDLWLCWHAASPHEVIPEILRQLADGALSDDQVEAISRTASDWTRKRHTYHSSDAVIITQIAAREAQK